MVEHKKVHVAVVGATGAVGRELISILGERRYPIASLRALASERSAGESIDIGDSEVTAEVLGPQSFDGIDLVFFAAGGSVSREWAPRAAEAGAVSIDKSSLFRLDDDVPLVVPEVNGDALDNLGPRKLVATPNCSTIQLVQVLGPLHAKAGLKRVMVSTYQAVSGAGRAGVDELERQVRDLFNFRELESTAIFGRQIAFNTLPCIPGTDAFLDDGSTKEERKMIDEPRKILGLPELRVGVTCARVPVFNSHSEAVHVELERPLSPEEARAALAEHDTISIVDNPETGLYPTPIDAAGQDVTLVGRIRRDEAFDNGLALWIASDNLRTGAALNAVRIAEVLHARGALGQGGSR